MLKIGFQILIFILILSCNWIPASQISKMYGENVYSRAKVIELFQISAFYIKQNCTYTEDALNYMINKGFSKRFTYGFYKQKSVEGCLILFMVQGCPDYTDTSTLISYYKSLIYNCKLKPVTIRL